MTTILAGNIKVRAYLCLVATTFCWGCNSIFARLIVGEVSPLLVVSLRWGGTVILMSVFARNTISQDWPVLKRNLPLLFLMGGLGLTAFNALFYVAAHTTTALNIGIIQGAIPVCVLIGSYIVYKTQINTLQIVGVIVTIAGVCIVASAGDLQQLASLSIREGDYFMIIASVLYSAYALTLRRFKGTSPLSLFAVIAAAAFIASIPLSLWESAHGDLHWPTSLGWIIVLLITLLPSFLAQIFFIQGVTDLGADRAGIFVNLVPVFAAILAVSILHEPFQWYHGVALCLVLSGIWLSERMKN